MDAQDLRKSRERELEDAREAVRTAPPHRKDDAATRLRIANAGMRDLYEWEGLPRCTADVNCPNEAYARDASGNRVCFDHAKAAVGKI